MGLSLCIGDWFESLFRSYDRDGSGFLDPSELSSLLTQALKQVNVDHQVSSF